MLAQAKPVAELVQPDIAASMQSGAARVIDVASLPTMMPSSANNTANNEPVAEEKAPERILKSDLLKPSDELEKLAKRQASAYRQGNHSDEVKLLQEALIKLGFELGKAGADGDFGSKTKTAIEQFQKSYQPSHQTHPSYSIGPVDGIVGKGTLLALDEALMDGWESTFECKLMINFDFIKELEGVKKHGYVPDVKGSNSGVTIASGLDLGARSKSDLITLGLPTSLIDKLTPYLGYKKHDAEAILAENPLLISDQELDILVSKVKESETNRIVDLYNRMSKVKKFECLPWQAQTVIASVAYQYGYLPSETKDFWKQAIEQNWSAMYGNLMNFGDKYSTRRQKEAKLIGEIK